MPTLSENIDQSLVHIRHLVSSHNYVHSFLLLLLLPITVQRPTNV